MPSLKYLKCEFLPISNGPHPIWLSCSGSPSSVHAATIHAKILCGTYRCDALLGKFASGSVACSLPDCNAPLGDVLHLLSGECPALRIDLENAVVNGLADLLPYPLLHGFVCTALERDAEGWISFVIDPSTDPIVIPYKQEFGVSSIFPLFKFSRTYTWAMHRTHYRLKGLSKFLK